MERVRPAVDRDRPRVAYYAIHRHGGEELARHGPYPRERDAYRQVVGMVRLVRQTGRSVAGSRRTGYRYGLLEGVTAPAWHDDHYWIGVIVVPVGIGEGGPR